MGNVASVGGTESVNPYNNINCVNNAAAFFNNVRTPAALLVIPALNALWVDLRSTTSRTKHPVAQTLYTLSAMVTVLLELVCVFVSTVAGTRLMAGGFDPMSSDAVTLLVREFELPYLTTHLSFVFGLVSFMSSISLRVWIQMGDNMSPKMGRALTLLTLTFVSNMILYFHQSINRFHLGLPGLLMRFVVLYVHSFGLVGISSLVAVAVCLHLTFQVIMEQVRQHGAPTVGLSVDTLPQMSPPAARLNPIREPIRGGSSKLHAA